jgi:Glycosyltransferases involved in cell wall biogenesis
LKNDLASIIIPVYNGERYISQAIESALSQTYPYKEIIVVDDASTDRTPQVVKSYPVIYYRNEKNMERAYSRNKGVELSKGEYLFFLDYDDLWEKDYVELSVEFLKKHDVVYSFPRTFVDSSGNVKRVSKKKIPGDSLILLFSGMMGYPSATAFRRSAFLGYKHEYLMREDWEILLRAYINGLSIHLLDNKRVLIREHPKRTSRSKTFLNATYKVYIDYKDKVPEKYLPYFLFHIGETALRFGELKEGWLLVLNSIYKKPSMLLDSRKILSILKRGFRFWKR